MPTYDYRCRKCGHVFELFHSMRDEGVKRCPRCRGRALRVPASGVGLLFKGSGFYITDYRSKDYREQARREKSGGESKSPGGAEGKSPAGGEPKPLPGKRPKPTGS